MTFPGFDKPVPKGQIICSCPITDASSGSAQGYQILGPYPCDKSFFNPHSPDEVGILSSHATIMG